MHETLHVLSPDQWDVFAELLAVQLDQPAAVAGFLLAHPLEHRGRGREVLAQPVRVVGVDALVFLLQGDGQRQHFALGKIVKVPHVLIVDWCQCSAHSCSRLYSLAAYSLNAPRTRTLRILPSAPPGTVGARTTSNARFQSAEAAQLPVDQVPQLKLKWAFGFPGVRSVLGQPSIAGGRVYIGVDTGMVYALDANTGCMYWSYKADAGVRTAVTVASLTSDTPPRYTAYFGDLKANVYAVNAATGELIWKLRVDDHASARITGAPKVFENRVYAPVASGEEGAGGNANYACCTFRGSVTALDATTGKQIWKTYTVADAPKQVGKNSNGVLRWAPAGGGVWNSPTIDAKRRALYIGTGDAYTSPAPDTTDSIMAMDLDSGKILWSVQETANDTWLAGCNGAKLPENCPPSSGRITTSALRRSSRRYRTVEPC